MHAAGRGLGSKVPMTHMQTICGAQIARGTLVFLSILEPAMGIVVILCYTWKSSCSTHLFLFQFWRGNGACWFWLKLPKMFSVQGEYSQLLCRNSSGSWGWDQASARCPSQHFWTWIHSVIIRSLPGGAYSLHFRQGDLKNWGIYGMTKSRCGLMFGFLGRSFVRCTHKGRRV